MNNKENLNKKISSSKVKNIKDQKLWHGNGILNYYVLDR